MKTVNRRTVLRGFGGAAIALPYLEVMMPAREARAQGGITSIGKNGRPKRLMVVETLLGQSEGWHANKNGPDGLVLGEILAPMVKAGSWDHRKDLLLVDGVCNTVAMGTGQDEHDIDATITTCLATGGTSSNIGDDTPPRGTSFDQVVAQAIRGDTKFESIQMAISGPNCKGNFISTKNSAPLAPYTEPLKMFNLLFQDVQTDPLVFEKIRVRKKSILDSVRGEYQTFAAKVSAPDRLRVQNHMDAIRELEGRVTMASTGPVSGVCGKPATPGAAASYMGPGRYVTKGRVNMDLALMAMACDLTRVATLDWNNVDTSGGPIFDWIPGQGVLYHHNISHNGPPYGSTVPPPQWAAISKWQVEYMAAFIQGIKDTQDGPGSLFDNTLFVWINEFGAGVHYHVRYAGLIAASPGGYLKTNQQLNYPFTEGGGFHKVLAGARGLADYYVPIMNAMGAPITTFGDPKYFIAPMKEMVAT